MVQQSSMFNAPTGTRRRRQVEPATAAQLSRIAHYSQTGNPRQLEITRALVMYQRSGGEVSRGRALAVIDACASGHAGSFVVMLLEHHGGDGTRASGTTS